MPRSRRLFEGLDQPAVVAGVQADARFVEDVEDALQTRAHLSREADALRLAARKRRGAALDLEVAEADRVEELEARRQLLQDLATDLVLAVVEFQGGDEGRADRRRSSPVSSVMLFDRGSAPRSANSFRRLPPAVGAGQARHEAFHVLRRLLAVDRAEAGGDQLHPYLQR